MAYVELIRNPFVILHKDPVRKLVRFRRTEQRLPADQLQTLLEEMMTTYEQLLPVPERATWALLQDMRDAPILNQAAEPILLRYLPRMVAGFRKRALLLRTAIGLMQARRTLQNLKSQPPSPAAPLPPQPDSAVFDDEALALSYLLAAD